MQANADRVCANRSPFPRLPTGAKVFDVRFAFDNETGAVGGLARIHHTFKNGWRPIRTQHFVHCQVSTGLFHCFPPNSTLDIRLECIRGVATDKRFSDFGRRIPELVPEDLGS